MEDKFSHETLNQYLQVISDNYCRFLLFYNLYHEFLLLTSTWEHQNAREAEMNVVAANKYRSVFNWIQWLINLAIIELHKLFDKSKSWSWVSTVNLHFIVDYIDSNKDEINNKEITANFILNCKKKIDKLSTRLKNLWNSRNNRSHNLKIQKPVTLSFKDIEILSLSVDDLFNYIDTVLRSNSWSFSHFNDEPKRDMDMLINDLTKLREVGFLIMNNSWKKSDTEILKEIKAVLHLDYY